MKRLVKVYRVKGVVEVEVEEESNEEMKKKAIEKVKTISHVFGSVGRQFIAVLQEKKEEDVAEGMDEVEWESEFTEEDEG